MSDNPMPDDLNRAADALKSAADQAASAVQQSTDAAADAVAQAADQAAAATQRAAGSAAQTTKSAVNDLVQTLERTSNQVADSARSFWESEQRREIQDSVVKGLNNIATAIEEQVKKLSQTDEAKRFVTKMEETTDRISEQVRSSKTFNDIAEGLMKGFAAAAASLEKYVGQQGSGSQSGAAADPGAALVPPDDTQTITIENRAGESLVNPPAQPTKPSTPDDIVSL